MSVRCNRGFRFPSPRPGWLSFTVLLNRRTTSCRRSSRGALPVEHSIVLRPADRRDLVFVEDVVAALLLMAAAPLPRGALINIASGVAPTMRKVAQLVIEQTGVRPDLVEYGDGSSPGGASDLRPSPERARDLLGWHARVGLAEGLSRTVNWYRDRVLHQ